MATHEKLQKSLEALRNLSQHGLETTDPTNRKKEIIQHCYVVTDAVSNPTIRISTNFHYILGSTIETFLKLTDALESDIRMTAEECLIRIIRATNDGYVGKIQIELHKEIKKNGATRPLRIALWLFSVLAHNIRPHKGKPYVTNLFPNLIKITERPEESVHETLALSLPKILTILSCFTTENEMKALLKAFLANVGNNSTVIRRCTTTSVLNICLNCRKPSTFLSYCLIYLLDLLIPICDYYPNSLILGALSTMKTLIPNFYNNKTQETELNVITNKLLQVFELCLYYLSHSDHNIINVSLETLQVLINNCEENLRSILLCEKGWGFNRIISRSKSALSKQHSLSELSIATNVTAEESLFSESELTETIHNDIERWIDGSRLSVMNVTTDNIKNRSESLNAVNRLDAETERSGNIQYADFGSNIKSRSVGDNLNIFPKSDNSSDRSLSDSTDDKITGQEDIQEIDIGDLLHNGPPIVYCIRLITTQFLLKGSPGCGISDKIARVSVKHLALACLSSIFRLYPTGFFLWLDKNFSGHGAFKGMSSQNVCDIFLFRNHSDPQLRGAIRSLLANFIKTVSHISDDGYEKWLEKYGTPEHAAMLQGKGLVDVFIQGLEDESSTCVRQTLLSLNISLPYLLQSQQNQALLPLLEVLPVLAQNPYWLVKVALCELVSKIDYTSIFYLLDDSTFQDKVIYNVLYELLDDSDQRVRNAAAIAVREICPRLYFQEFKIGETPVTSRAVQQTKSFLRLLDQCEIGSNINEKHFIESMPYPFDKILDKACDKVDFTLSKIIFRLSNILSTTTSKNLINGCIETLSLLSDAYPCTVYRLSWGISENSYAEEIPDLLKLCISFLLDTNHVYDIQTHINLLKLLTNLYSGHAVVLLKPLVDVNVLQSMWSMFLNETFSQISEQCLTHAVKMLNVFHHVLNDLVPTNQFQPKNVLSNLPTPGNLSPMKRRKSDLDKKILMALKTEKEDRTEKKDGARPNSVLINFSCSTRYIRIFDILKTAFVNYKISLDSDSSQKFLELLVANLRMLSVLMEIGTLNEFSRIAEEILSYLRSTFSLDASTTIHCVEQLLKCLFGTNLTVNISELSLKKEQNSQEESEDVSFYHKILQEPYNLVVQHFTSLNNSGRIDLDNEITMMGYLHRKTIKRGSVVLFRSSDKILANYIRIFEPMVIKSLKQYTITSDVNLQCQVLQLLNQLVKLRVNYCLLDSEQVFIGFVLKQFEFIEEGQIPLSERLIPKIFQFLVQLSYSRQHSKSIIGIPKIIQLCDGLMASGQPSSTHCIPALQPLVEDIFLGRNKSNTSDTKELETTREVVLSMLLRLWENQKVTHLITLILEDSKYCADNSEKWFDWSKRVFAVVFPVLKQNRLKLEQMETLMAMKKLILTLHPDVFKPFDEIIATMFQDPPYPDADLSSFNIWLSKMYLLLLIITLIKEDLLISKIEQLKSEFSPNSIYENVITKADPLNVFNNADTFGNILPETIFVKMVFRVISLIAGKSCLALKNEEKSFIVEQFSVFLLHCICLFQFGSYCKLSGAAVCLMKKDSLENNQEFNITNINKNMLLLSTFQPVVTFYWNYLLSLLNHSDRETYLNYLFQPTSEKLWKNPSINKEIAKNGCLISLCDYLCENSSENDFLKWFLTISSPYLIDLCDEGPVFEFITFLHRNSTLCSTFLDSIKCFFNDSVYKMKLLRCIEHCHANQTGQVLKLLIPNLLKTYQEALSRKAANLASRKIELLLTMSSQDVVKQFLKEDLVQMQQELVELKLIQKHEALVSLLNKLGTQHFGLPPVEFEQRRLSDPKDIRKLQIDRKWYLNQVHCRFSSCFVSKETTQLLNCLEYNEIVSFMSSSDFNRSSLKDCVKLGLSSCGGNEACVVLKAVEECVLKNIANIVSRVDFNSQNELEMLIDPTKELYKHFKDKEFVRLLNDVSPCVPLLLSARNVTNINGHLENLMKFAAISLVYLRFILREDSDFPVEHVEVLLTCADAIFRHSDISRLLDSKENLMWFCPAVNGLFQLVEVLLKFDKPIPSIPNYFPRHVKNKQPTETSQCIESTDKRSSSDTDEVVQATVQAVHRLYILVCWFNEIKCINRTKIPDFLFSSIKTITISLSRLSIANSYLLVPLKAWRTGWTPETLSGTFKTQIPAIPIEILQDVEVLEEYIFRMNLLGWTTRQQFEETWMGLLSIFCYPLDNMDALEVNEVLHSSSLAIKSITSLLLSTLTCSDIGNPVATFLHVSRNTFIPEDSISTKKLRIIQDSIEKCYKECSSLPPSNFLNVFTPRNLEKLGDKYGHGQLSIKYFLITTDIIKEAENDLLLSEVVSRRRNLLDDNGLDLNSCLQFLLDYYTQLMRPQTSTHIRVLHEAIRSTVIISDLFMDKSQFSWMLDIFLELTKLHAVEDELLPQYLIVGICKAVSILNPDLEVYEQVKRMLVQYLKSPYLSSRMACLYGLLYLLEGCKLNNIAIGSISDEMQLLLPCAVEYVQFNLSPANNVLKKSQEHFNLVWSLAFYLIENIGEMHMEQNFVANTLNAAFTLLTGRINLQHQTIFKGLERLLIIKKTSIIEPYGKQYLKLALDKMKSDNPTVAIMATQLLLSYLYTDCAEHLRNEQGLPASPDHLVQTIEKISAIFERIKKGYVHEVEILSFVLPKILDDFFSPSDVLTKVIGEFLSSQQPHPKLLSKVVFQVFESAIKKDQLSLLQDWVVFSLSNFTQSFSIGMATWCLTCFFISASSNPWLRSYFPYVQTRVGRYEYEDRKMLFIAGADFYNALTNEKQKTTFVETFSKVRDQPDTPFNDLLLSL